MSLSSLEFKANPRTARFTKYQKVIIISLIMVLIFQVGSIALFIIFDHPILWQAWIVFSGAISLGGFLLTSKVGWDLEGYEQRLKQAVFEKYGFDLDDPDKHNVMTLINTNQETIARELNRLDEDKFKAWIAEQVDGINNHTTRQDMYDEWAEEFGKEKN